MGFIQNEEARKTQVEHREGLRVSIKVSLVLAVVEASNRVLNFFISVVRLG